MDYIMFTNAKTKDEVVYKILDTMAKNKPDMVAVAPVMSDFSPAEPSIASTTCSIIRVP